MKKLIAIAICLFIGLSAFGQSSTTLEGTEAYYLQKRKSAQTTGWIMLGGGLAMTVVGINSTLDNIFSENTGAEVLAIVGLGISIASIIPFSKAGKYKRKAAAVAVGFQEITPLLNYGYASSNNLPAVRLTVNLNGNGN